MHKRQCIHGFFSLDLAPVYHKIFTYACTALHCTVLYCTASQPLATDKKKQTSC